MAKGTLQAQNVFIVENTFVIENAPTFHIQLLYGGLK